MVLVGPENCIKQHPHHAQLSINIREDVLTFQNACVALVWQYRRPYLSTLRARSAERIAKELDDFFYEFRERKRLTLQFHQSGFRWSGNHRRRLANLSHDHRREEQLICEGRAAVK
jgi:hypothetical protein